VDVEAEHDGLGLFSHGERACEFDRARTSKIFVIPALSRDPAAFRPRVKPVVTDLC